jgi:hypothetical protein
MQKLNGTGENCSLYPNVWTGMFYQLQTCIGTLIVGQLWFSNYKEVPVFIHWQVMDNYNYPLPWLTGVYVIHVWYEKNYIKAFGVWVNRVPGVYGVLRVPAGSLDLGQGDLGQSQ